MKVDYEKILDIIDIEWHEEMMCAEKSKWLMKRSLNPIRKLIFYMDAKRFMAHVFGIELVRNKIRKTLGES